MTDERELAGIADALNIKAGETVLEIGPGAGALTKALLERGARVIAIEKDTALAKHLEQNLCVGNGRDRSLRVICGDILKFDLGSLNLSGHIKVAGNIPYNITSPIIEWLISHRAVVSEAVLTVQWEVAQRLSAMPGGKEWGSLSVFLQFYADVELLRKIDKSRFYPAPKVDSSVIRMRFLENPRFAVADEALFFHLVRRAFQKRRKTLLNALAEKEGKTLTKEALSEAFSSCGIDGRRRPETLSIGEWACLAARLG